MAKYVVRGFHGQHASDTPDGIVAFRADGAVGSAELFQPYPAIFGVVKDFFVVAHLCRFARNFQNSALEVQMLPHERRFSEFVCHLKRAHSEEYHADKCGYQFLQNPLGLFGSQNFGGVVGFADFGKDNGFYRIFRYQPLVEHE